MIQYSTQSLYVFSRSFLEIIISLTTLYLRLEI